MGNAPSPREIQARIRGGESVSEVADSTGADIDFISAFAGPVLAEREHATLLAKKSPVRRPLEASSTRQLAPTVHAAVRSRFGIDADGISWDSWRNSDRRWFTSASWTRDDEEYVAVFDLNLESRYLVASNDLAVELLGGTEERPSAQDPVDLDDEPTVDLHDEMAIVRVVSEEEPPAIVPDVPSSKIMKLPSVDEDDVYDYQPAQFTEVDGVLDLAPSSDMDVLYDMLSGFNEDSIRIYRQLAQSSTEDPALSADTSQHSAVESSFGFMDAEDDADDDNEPTTRVEAMRTNIGVPDAALPPPEAGSKPAQEALLATPEAENPPRKTQRRRKRASVPSWDEIMFGAPKQDEE